ncbi:Serine/threonine-protein kinase-like protein CCR4 [Triticum urartu]|uniref:Serine/threonine-protein kinase-like protein CCR4 n=1 Tax=Triticum urartu TaxID=4572 RepID=M8AN31_TRIUA|nr:Serine/threonine-protein kinase-like protein CCR4 [Triticum urartu]
MSRRPGLATSTTRLLVVIAFLLAVAAAAAPPSPRQFSTVAISHTRNSTLVCALIIDRVNEDGGGNSKLQCKSMPDGRLTSYPSADIPFNAIAAGKDFLCGLMAPVGGHAAMRWWSFTEEEEARRSRPVGRRIYWGPSLRSMSAGGPHVCGLSDDHDPTCWEWPGLDLPKGLDFSLIALGQDFLCGIVKGDDTAMRCYGGAMPSTPQFTADGVDVTFQTVAAGRRHACAVDKLGGLVCWGDGNPTVRLDELPADMMAMALGRNTTCILAGNGTVRCWGVKVPEEYTHTTFVSIEADGDTVPVFALSLGGGASASASPTTTSGTAGTVGYMDPEYYRLQELTERSDVYSFGVVLLELVTGRKAIHRDQSQEGSGSPRNVIEFAVPAVEAGNIDKILDSRVPAPRGHEVEAVARVAKIGAECVRPRGRGRPVMSEVVAELEWAVTLCEECVVRSASGGRNSSSRNGGSDMSRSRSRSESEDRSPYHTREFSFGSGRVAGVGHARSYSTM